MKNKVVTMFLTLCCSSTFADSWTTQDKKEHAIVSAMFGTMAGAAIEDKYVAFGVAMLPGIAKELYDATGKGTPSWKDLGADIVGSYVGVVLGNCLIRNNSIRCFWEF